MISVNYDRASPRNAKLPCYIMLSMSPLAAQIDIEMLILMGPLVVLGVGTKTAFQ